MSKNWYPVIDYSKCTECGICVNICPQDVYDKGKGPRPVVINAKDCIEGCHGCGNVCTYGAIEYASENTDWKPLIKTINCNGCNGCGGSCGGDCGGDR